MMIRAKPFIPCTSLEAQLAFYRDRLGFTVGYQMDNYAYLHRDGAALRLVEVDDSIDLHDPRREQSFYVDVEDVDALWSELAPRLSDLPDGRVRAPFDQDYGQRELHVIDEDCTLIFFGQAITRG